MEAGAAPDLTPMIDVIFQLLVFFLLTSFALVPSIAIDLPASRTASAKDRPPLEIAVPATGPYLIDGSPAEARSLAGLLRGEKEEGAVSLTLRADREAPFERVMAVLDAANEAGFEVVDVLAAPLR